MLATYSFIEGLKTTRRSFEDETPHEKFPADLVIFTEGIFSGKYKKSLVLKLVVFHGKMITSDLSLDKVNFFRGYCHVKRKKVQL